MAADGKKVIPPISIETQRVVRRLTETAVGDVVSWEELESLTGIPRSRVYNMVRTAKTQLENERKMHFKTCIGAGVERIDYNAVARETLPCQRKRMASAANRMVRTTRNVILDQMGQDERTTVLVHQTLGELTKMACSNKSTKQLSGDFDKERLLTPMTAKEAMAKLMSG